ncbi:hypothetical protein N4R57_03585 [Rhodobacteraceae bacterium D3-12]|nr:hypothetical protein N4R57_03585 [Rhodobacteraceae bacterium D3-12]
MFFAALTYLILALFALAALSVMILRIGAMMSECRGTPAARTAAVTIATGYGAIGFGFVLIAAAGLAMFSDTPVIGLLLTSGFVALCLGLGFSQAITTLRAVLDPPAKAA